MSLPSDNRPPAGLTIRVDPMLSSLIPQYLECRGDDVQTIALALEAGDFGTIQSLGHRMKGSGGSMGFDEISDIGAALEAAAIDQERSVICKRINQLRGYLETVDVVYE